MEESFSVPNALSYRSLQAYLQNALAESTAGGPGAEPAAAQADPSLEAALEAWRRSSEQLLQRLQQAGPELGGARSPRQLMALGALQAHVAIGLQALASSRRSSEGGGGAGPSAS